MDDRDDEIDLDKENDLDIPNEDGELEDDEDEESLEAHGFHDPDADEEETL